MPCKEEKIMNIVEERNHIIWNGMLRIEKKMIKLVDEKTMDNPKYEKKEACKGKESNNVAM